MKRDDPEPQTKPGGNKPPPRPPDRTALGLGPDGDDSDKGRRATITKAADGEGKFIRQSGGMNHYGHVIIKIEPNGRGKGIKVLSDILPGAIPVEYIKPVIDAVRDALDCGMGINHSAVSGCPIVDIVVLVVNGSCHETDSSELAFRMAGIFAITDAIKKADPIVIE